MDTLGIIRQLRADAALADELRAVLLSQDLLGLPERVAKLDERVAQLRLDLAEMDDRLTRRLNRLDNDMAVLKGMGLEDRVRGNPRRYLSQVVRKAELAQPDDFDLGVLDPADAGYLRDTDAVLRGQDLASGDEVLLTVEVSWGAHQDDLDKVARRARLLALASKLPTLPVVVSHDTPAQVVIDHARAAGIALAVPGGGPPLSGAAPRPPS